MEKLTIISPIILTLIGKIIPSLIGYKLGVDDRQNIYYISMGMAIVIVLDGVQKGVKSWLRNRHRVVPDQ